MQTRIVSYELYDEVYLSFCSTHEKDFIYQYKSIIENAAYVGDIHWYSRVFCGREKVLVAKEFFHGKNRVSLIFGREGEYMNFEAIFIRKKKDGVVISEKWNQILLATPEYQLFHIEDIRTPSSDFIKETASMYQVALKSLSTVGMSFSNVIRSWNYIEEVLAHYADFNRARDTFFDSILLSEYPAGTGIDCRLLDGAKMSSSILAYSAENSSITHSPVRWGRQCEARRYGPKFSRAELLCFHNENRNKLFISGTAAVSPTGETLYSDDIDENINYTMGTVFDILQEASMDWTNVTSSIVYLKRPEFLSHFQLYLASRNINIPFVYNFCDVCRDDWLFEIECIAVS